MEDKFMTSLPTDTQNHTHTHVLRHTLHLHASPPSLTMTLQDLEQLISKIYVTPKCLINV